jgi:SdpC family antimicrobial peptide
MFLTIRRRFVQNAVFIVPLLVAFGFVACDDGVVTPEEQEARLGAVVAGRSLEGTDYYEGIFFGKGPVATAIPEIKENYAIVRAEFTEEELSSIAAQQATLLGVIRDYDPGFFDRFEAAIESGNRIAIQNSLKEAGAVTLFAYMNTDEGRQALGLAQQPENIAQITQEINERGGIGQLTEQEVADALRDVEAAVAGGSNPATANFALCIVLAIAVVVVVAIALLLVLIAAVAVAIALVGWLWVVLHTYVWVWSAKAKGMLTELQIEQLIDSLATRYGPVAPQTPIGYTD